MKLKTVISALILLLISSTVFSFSFSAPNYNHFSSNVDFQESFEIEEATYLRYDINLSVQVYLEKVPFFPGSREYNNLNSTKEKIDEEYFCISYLINPALSIPEIIYPFHSFL